MSNTVSSYIPTTGAVFERGRDVLSLPFTARPEAATFYVRFIEKGTISIAGARLLQIGNTASSNPKLFVSHTGAGDYGIRWINTDGTTVASTPNVTPSIGDDVEFLGILNADGSVQGTTVVNGTTTSGSASSAQVLPTSWAGTTLLIGGGLGAKTLDGFNPFLNISIMRGVQTLATMRRIARSI
jgi:hypothetical protein